MKKYSFWLIAILVVLAGYFMLVVNAIKKLTYIPAGGENLSFRNGAISFVQKIRVVNGDNVGFTINSVNIQNYFGNTILGTCLIFEPARIAARSESILKIAVIIPYKDLIFLIPEAVQAVKSKLFKFRFEGTVNALGVNANIKQQYEIDFGNLI